MSSSSLVRSTYRRMMKYLLRHWCMEIKCDGNGSTSRRRTRKNASNNGGQKSNDDITSDHESKSSQTIRSHIDDDIILSDAQLEWEHEEGIQYSPKMRRKSEQDLLDNLLTHSQRSVSSYSAATCCPDFEWDNLFDFAL